MKNEREKDEEKKGELRKETGLELLWHYVITDTHTATCAREREATDA